MARRKRGSDVSGFFLLDKPSGPTSNQVLQRTKRLFNARKAGHTGTLDPLATGMLPICLGEATKTAAFAIQADKVYEVTGLLGVATDTGDALGEITRSVPAPALTADELTAALTEFTGTIKQRPPRYSAVRHEGRRMYELARAGIEAPRPKRSVTIHALELLGVELPAFTIRVRCSKGTYVRTLIEDIAISLGSIAHVTALRRISVDPFAGQAMVTIEELEAVESAEARADRFLLPVDFVLTDWPRVEVSAQDVARLRQGQKIVLDQGPEAGKIRMYDTASHFVGIGDVSSLGELFPKRIFL